jgi:hypothetical protein
MKVEVKPAARPPEQFEQWELKIFSNYQENKINVMAWKMLLFKGPL